MLDSKCFHLRFNGCDVLFDTECSDKCPSRIVDSDKYVEMLRGLIRYNSKNKMAVGRLYVELEQHLEDMDVKFKEWKDVYVEESRRGERGGQSEGNVNSAGIKARMKDNRAPECRIVSKAVREEIKREIEEFEKVHGKLERLSRNSMSRSKIDGYTGSRIK